MNIIAEATARGLRLREDEAVRRSLIEIWGQSNDYLDQHNLIDTQREVMRNAWLLGRAGLSTVEFTALLQRYEYLWRVPATEFKK